LNSGTKSSPRYKNTKSRQASNTMMPESLFLQAADTAQHNNEDWKRVKVMNELETSIRQLLLAFRERGVPNNETVEIHVEDCNYDEALLWAMNYSSLNEKHLLNHSWNLLCHYQTLRLGFQEKERWLWTMAQRIHSQNKLTKS